MQKNAEMRTASNQECIHEKTLSKTTVKQQLYMFLFESLDEIGTNEIDCTVLNSITVYSQTTVFSGSKLQFRGIIKLIT